MKKLDIQFLKDVTRHHCQRMRAGTLNIRNCTLIHIAPSNTVMVNNRIWEKPDHVSYEDYFKGIGGTFFEDSKNLPYVVTPWNKAAEFLNTGLRNAWRFNFEVDYKDHHTLNPFIVYDVKVTQSVWSNIIRHYRNRALTELDLEFQVALENSDSEGIEEIGLIRQMLRDLPHDMNIEQYDTAAKIVSFWPTILLPAPDFVTSAEPEAPQADNLD